MCGDGPVGAGDGRQQGVGASRRSDGAWLPARSRGKRNPGLCGDNGQRTGLGAGPASLGMRPGSPSPAAVGL